MEKAELEWFECAGKGRVGISGFDNPPPWLIEFSDTLSRKQINSKCDFILFPNRQEAIGFLREATRPEDRPFSTDFSQSFPGKSRYLLFKHKDGRIFFLVNTNGLSFQSLDFMAHVLEREFEIALSYQNKTYEKLAEVLYEFSNSYSQKFHVPASFNIKDLGFRTYHISIGAVHAYAEFVALHESMTSDNIAEAKVYLEGKLEAVILSKSSNEINSLPQAMNLLGDYFHMLEVIISTQKWPALGTFFKTKKETIDKNVSEIVTEHEDLRQALAVLGSRVRPEVFENGFENYLLQINEILSASFDKLRPDYVWPDATEVLDRLTQLHILALENKEDSLGGMTLKQFLLILQQISNTRGVYPEVPIYAGLCAVILCEAVILRRQDLPVLRIGISVAVQTSKQIEENLSQIKKKNPDSPFSYYTALHPLLTISKLCAFVGMNDKNREFRKIFCGTDC